MWIFWLNLFTLYSLNSSKHTHTSTLMCNISPSLELCRPAVTAGSKRVGKKFQNMCQLYTFLSEFFFASIKRKKKCVWASYAAAPMGKMMVNKLWCKFSCLLNFIFLTRVFNCCCFMFRYVLDLQLSFCEKNFNSVFIMKATIIFMERFIKIIITKYFLCVCRDHDFKFLKLAVKIKIF
jgi:hypothetical protein